MSILSASNLAKSYGAQDVFDGVSFAIPHGAKIALVGPNGAGKTTLLHLMAELEAPTRGDIHRAKNMQTAYLPQKAEFALGQGNNGQTLWETMLEVFADLLAQEEELRRLEAAMSDPDKREKAARRYGTALEQFELDGGYTYEARIKQVLAGLGFAEKEDFHRPVAQFSGGEKTRALLARLLLEEPDLLLLDEPTNHLDLSGVEWLERYLQTWQGAMVVVAHDRAFLDAIADRVWEVAWGRMEQYRGNYSAYVIQKEERLAHRRAQYERQQETIAQTEDFIRRNIAGQRSQEAQGRRKRLERLERIERPREYHTISLAVDKAARSGDLVLGLYDLTVGYNQAAPLLTAKEFELRRGQRVALLGPNGAGKTSLVRTILGEISPLAGRVRIGANVHVGYFTQGHTDLDPDQSVIDTILNAAWASDQPERRMTTGQARDLLGRYRFSGDDVFKRVGDLSGGEQARVALALLILRSPNFLLLDEPTNHLDIPTQEVLEEALNNFDGTLLMVSHDRYLIRRLSIQVWAIEGERLWEFKRGYETYRNWLADRRQREREIQRTRDNGEQERRRALRAQRAAEREAAQKARRQAELEQRIHELELRQARLEGLLAQASEEQAVDKVRELGAEYGKVGEELETLLIAWEETA